MKMYREQKGNEDSIVTNTGLHRRNHNHGGGKKLNEGIV
jgi:hypothetical protein